MKVHTNFWCGRNEKRNWGWWWQWWNNDNGDDDNNDDNDGGGGDSVDDEGNFVDGITANGDVSNIKHSIGETRCFLKHKSLQVGEEITFIRNNSFINIRPNKIQWNFDTIYWDTSSRSNITNIKAMYTQFKYINYAM